METLLSFGWKVDCHRGYPDFKHSLCYSLDSLAVTRLLLSRGASYGEPNVLDGNILFEAVKKTGSRSDAAVALLVRHAPRSVMTYPHPETHLSPIMFTVSQALRNSSVEAVANHPHVDLRYYN